MTHQRELATDGTAAATGNHETPPLTSNWTRQSGRSSDTAGSTTQALRTLLGLMG